MEQYIEDVAADSGWQGGGSDLCKEDGGGLGGSVLEGRIRIFAGGRSTHSGMVCC